MQFTCKSLVIGLYAFIGGLVVIDEVHLIDTDRNMGNAQQRGDKGVPFGLFNDPFTRIDQDYGKIGCRCARDHISRVLNMARSIRDNEFSLWRSKVTIGHINGDSLLTLRL